MATQFGTSGNDTLSGSSDGDTIVGQAGDDTINGGGGNDILLGNQGNDQIADGDGQNTVYGGMNNDRITVGNGSNLLFGNEGSDTIMAGGGNNTIVGGQDSTDGADLITSGLGNDLILGNGGDDTVAAGGGADTVVGGYGRDIILGNQGNDIILGNQGDDTLFGGQGSDTLIGGQGNDFLIGGEDNDLIVGSEGDDTASFSGTRASYTITQDAAGDFILSGASGTDTVSTVEHFQFSDGTIDAASLIQGTGGGGGGTVTPPPVNNTPVANSDVFNVQAENALTIAPQRLLVNDTDADGDPLTVTGVTSPAHGTLTQDQNGSYIYTPDQAYFGRDAFTYEANDGTANSNPATVNIAVIDNAPRANPDTNTATVGSNISTTGNVLSNDTDADVFPSGNSDGLTVINPGFYVGTYGSLDLNRDGLYAYSLYSSVTQPNGPTSDVFSYIISDAASVQSRSTLTISVQ